jgi:hypothetical protein
VLWLAPPLQLSSLWQVTVVFIAANAQQRTATAKEISSSPFSAPPYSPGSICPGALLAAIHPQNSHTGPYYSQLSAAQGRDVPEAEATI